MKRILSLLLTILLLLCLPAMAEDASGFPGVWIEVDGFGTLTILGDGTSRMEYYDGTVTECPWELTDEGAVFTEGQWLNSPMVLLDENTLSVANGWCIFAREGFLPTTDQALLLGAEPIGEAGLPFCGQWVLETIIMEGESYDPALFGMSMTVTFTADGLVTTDDGMEPYTTTWFESYGSAVVEGDILTLNEDGKLVMNASDGSMIFALVEPEVPEVEAPEAEITVPEVPVTEITEVESPESEFPMADEPAADPVFVPVGEEGAAFLGLWSLNMINADGMEMNPAMLGMSMALTFQEDGSVLYDDGWEVVPMPWCVENGAAMVDGMPLTLNAEGQLIMTDEDGAMMIFTAGAAAPAEELSEEEQMMALLALLGQMAELDSTDGMDYLNTKFVCSEFSTSGVTLDAATLGAEYAVFFREDNTADLTLAGYVIENLPYSINEEGVYVVNYYGAFFNCTPTDAGFDMDYYGTMTLHCTPAE